MELLPLLDFLLATHSSEKAVSVITPWGLCPSLLCGAHLVPALGYDSPVGSFCFSFYQWALGASSFHSRPLKLFLFSRKWFVLIIVHVQTLCV